MLRMYASNSHSHTHLILALGIVREPTVWVTITSEYPGIHDIGLPAVKLPNVKRNPEVYEYRLGELHGGHGLVPLLSALPLSFES